MSDPCFMDNIKVSGRNQKSRHVDWISTKYGQVRWFEGIDQILVECSGDLSGWLTDNESQQR